MYLKKLTIQGFKSFPNRTTFEFGRGVTAVVGPNGSGKSNVSDAIRWVLGEQSSRLLRARKQEDVIFTGGGERAAVGMAEVLLTLDNEDGRFPLDFSEVELGRRLYRDGRSEYLLNGSRVRLRDVSDLLLRNEVAQNSYTIMGQGLVDEVLLMSPEERRNFVDEAADVRRFRMRVSEAHERLAATRANLERVQLILSEIEPRLSQLGRQAARASEHSRLAAELLDLLQAYYGEVWSTTQNKLVGARAVLDQQAAETLESEQRVTTIQAQLQALADEIRKRRETLASRHAQKTQVEEAISAAERDLAVDRGRLEMLASREIQIRSEIESLEAELAAVPVFDEPREEDGTAAERNAAAQSRLAESRLALQDAEQKSAAARNRLRDLDLAITDSEKQERRHVEEARAAARDADRLEKDEIRSVEARRAILTELAAYGARFRVAREALRGAEASVDAARLTAEQARERLATAEQEQREAAKVDQGDLREIERLEGRLEALQRIQAEMVGLAAGTRNALLLGQPQHSESGEVNIPAEVQGVLGLLAQQIRVPAGLETAINAALEARLHAVVVEHEEDALKAIEILRERRAGRATVLSLDGVRHVYPLNLSKEKELVGVAAKLVKCDDRLRPLIETLLGRVIIVETTEAGLRTVKRGLGTVVTLDGTLIEPSGVLTGGATGAEEGPLLRQRELDELPEIIRSLRLRAESQTARPSNAQASVAQAARESHLANTDYEQVLRRINDSRTLVERERERLNRLRREIGAVQARIDDARAKREAAREAMTKAESLAHEAAQRRTELTAELAGLRAEAQQGAEHRESALTAFSEASSALAAAEAELKAAQLLRDQHRAASQRLTAQAETKRNQFAELEREKSVIAGRVASHEAALASLLHERDSRVDDSEPVRDELTRLETHERQVSDDLQTARANLLRLERMRLEIQSEVDRLSEQLGALRVEMARENLAPDRTGRIVPADEAAAGSSERRLQGGAQMDLQRVQSRLEELRREIRRLGPVNEEAPEDFQELTQRHEFLSGQVRDLEDAELQLRGVIDELNQEIKKRFGSAFAQVNEHFAQYFTAFFGGGVARLVLTNPDDLAETGIDIEAQPPGKKIRSLSLLSGGERSLTAVALLFALLTVNPAPFAVLDEVDAALDEANVTRFAGALANLAAKTQFIVVTHNRRTIEQADAIYGVSMGRDSVSKVLSVRLADVTKDGTVSSGARG